MRPIPTSLSGVLRTIACGGLAVALSCIPATAPEAVADENGLAPFFAALAALEAGRAPGPVAVLQVGDSHTANDSFSGRMRELFAARFGDGGRGTLPPGVPFRYYRPAGATVTAEGWTVAGSNGNSPAPPPFGLAGLRQEASGPATATLLLAAPAARGGVELLRQPGGGTVAVGTDDDPPTTVSTDGSGPLRVALAPRAPFRRVTLRARGDGPVAWLSWDTGRDAGVTWSNLGTPGAAAGLLRRWDPALLAAEMRAAAPALVVLAFGTNEGFRNRPDLDDPADFARALDILRTAAPDAALAVLLPPDGVRRAPQGGTGRAGGGECSGGFETPPGLAAVRTRARMAAGNAFTWDWEAAMGGRCAFVGWMAADPPLAAPDGVHLRQDGYRRTADAFFGALMRGYDGWRRTH